MPVDDIVPSKEKSNYGNRLKANMMSQMPQPGQEATPTQPDGSPKGGMDGNLVSNRASGAPK
jgi:hypothetical protein